MNLTLRTREKLLLDDTQHSGHQHAVETSERTTDTIRNIGLAHARVLVTEARTAIKHAWHDDTSMQEQREIIYDRYDRVIHVLFL